MCGACGRTVTADEVLGPVSTLRHRLIAAQTINALCHGLPGFPSVQTAGDTLLVRGVTGAVTQCSTVNDVWAAILQDPAVTLHRERLAHRMRRRSTGETGVALNVVSAGLRLAETLASDSA